MRRRTALDTIGSLSADHALARYKLRKLLPLIYDGLVEYLVLTMGWPANRLVRGQQFQDNRGATQTVEWRPEFVGKGIIFEFSSGNLIKLDQAGRVGWIQKLVNSAIEYAYTVIHFHADLSSCTRAAISH